MALSVKQQTFIDWLVTPKDAKDPPTQRLLAELIGTPEAELSRWKKDKDFIAEWEIAYRKVVGSPEKAMQVLEALHRTATDEEDPRQVPAARAYLDAIDAIKPPKIDITVKKGAAADLSDEELMAAMAEHAARELERRAKTMLADAPADVVDYSKSADKE